MRATRKGWSIRRQLVPERVRIPLDRWKIMPGDEVAVVSEASKDFGKRGKVLEILPLQNRLIVEGIHLQTKILKANEKQVRPGPIHYSNVHLIDPETDKPTRVKVLLGEDGKRRRVARSNAIIPYPRQPSRKRPTKEDSPQDTAASDVHEVTYRRYDEFMRKQRSRQAGLQTVCQAS
ncbi:hypothetical protein KFE25_008917 [Diacronema lutheri]|uniref:Large ribosomal subunit protein uL24 C-terminal domain-containing protein n=1 Tax=Diacronema lutheri TaxID=2081491 RepID=A0A8J6CGU8_DIALT|nr:hypothetical protein KFE25_008917 [Diacronema lutheri]